MLYIQKAFHRKQKNLTVAGRFQTRPFRLKLIPFKQTQIPDLSNLSDGKNFATRFLNRLDILGHLSIGYVVGCIPFAGVRSTYFCN